MRRFTARVLALSLVGSGLAVVPAAAGAASNDAKINEFVHNHTGTDTDTFVEVLLGTADPADLAIVEVEGDGSGAGTIDEIRAFDAANVVDGRWVEDLDAENGTLTLLLVRGLTATVGTDLDTDNDGTPDATPWAELVDSIAVDDGGSSDHTYGVTLERGFDDGFFTVGGASRIPDGTDTDTAADWVRNAFNGAGLPSFPDAIANIGEAINTPGAENLVAEADPCETIVPIYDIQGSGDVSPIVGSVVSTTGVVTEVTGSNVWLQDADGDGDPATSDAIEIYWGDVSDRPFLSDGDVVTFCGTVGERRGLTQLASIGRITVEGSTDPIDPMPFALPAPRDLESYESMLVAVDQTLYATDIYNALRFREAFFSGSEDLRIPTDIFEPGSAEAAALADENRRNTIKLSLDRDLYDDLQSTAGRYLRRGDAVAIDRVGHITETFNAKQFRIMGFPFFVQASDLTLINDRPGAPTVGDADTVVASFNVHNYWTSLLLEGEYRECFDIAVPGGDPEDWDDQDEAEPACGPGPRGAETAADLAVQEASLADAIGGLDADVVALQELETPGLGDRNADDDPNETLIALVDALNAAHGAGTWDYVPVGEDFLDANTNAIMSGFIYRTARVAPWGDMVALTDLASLYDRLPVAATFRRLEGPGSDEGPKFTVVNNHWKSKGCSGSSGADADQGDGQACFNATRVQQAQAVADWVDGDLKKGRTKRTLVLGDLNAYTKEDPIDVLRDAELVELLDEADGNSFTFFSETGRLDHAFATKQLAKKVTGAVLWDINADESNGLDYAGQIPSESRWRSSDHDPVVVGLDLLDD